MSSVTGLTGYYDYSALNGIAGTYNGGYSYSTPTFTGSIYGSYYGTDVDTVKENLENNYEISSTYQAYTNKQNAQTLDWQTLCSNISSLLQQGRTDAAMEEYDKLINSMTNAGQYEGYSESQIKALARQIYAGSMGSDLLNDIDVNVSGSFVQGFKEGIPVIGTLFAQGNSKDDAIAKVTGIEKSAGASAAKAAGAITSGAGTGAVVGAVAAAALGISGPFALVGAAVGGALAIGKLIFDK